MGGKTPVDLGNAGGGTDKHLLSALNSDKKLPEKNGW